MKSFKHIDPSSTFIYSEHTVWYGFELDTICFRCRVRNGYLTGKREDLPKDLAWAIGQHIDTLKQFVKNLMPLQIVPSTSPK